MNTTIVCHNYFAFCLLVYSGHKEYTDNDERLLEMASKSSPDYVSAAKQWSESSNFKLEIEDGNKKFTFKSTAVSFYVYVPESDSEGWVS